MTSSLVFSLLALLCGLLSAAGEVRYSGREETSRVLYGGLSRHTRQANTAAPPQILPNVTIQDSHDYYTSRFYPNGSDTAEQLWFDLTSDPSAEIIPESGISDSFRVFEAHDLPFTFQFYGHNIDLVAVTTGGFLYASDYLHSRIHLTQYIAPLQADFNPSISPMGQVLIHSDSNRFTVQWDNVVVTNHEDAGEFTFQVSLFPNGIIHFVYRNIPLPVSGISDNDHPVEVGLADSFYIDRPVPPNLILRQVFEYSRIQLSEDELSYSAYVLEPLPGCVPADTCERCVAASAVSVFECGWCPQLGRCSDGVDRFRQDWFLRGCPADSTTSCSSLPQTTQPLPATSSGNPTSTIVASQTTQSRQTTQLPSTTDKFSLPLVTAAPVIQLSPSSAQLSSGSIAGIAIGLFVVFLLAITIAGVIIALLVYGYKNPTSSVGMFMIEHRPKARSLNKGKASYEVGSGKMNLSED